ncbi:MAG: hypothetical protein R3C03_04090 [Pirellulaceae bacterium]
MSNNNSKDTTMMVIGVVGIFALLLVAAGYAYWNSGRHYEAEQVNQFVIEQAAEKTR